MRYLAPAKLNLFLHITGKNANNYHLLQSVFVKINWCDELCLSPRLDNKITRTGLDSVPYESDLCVKAARALQSHPVFVARQHHQHNQHHQQFQQLLCGVDISIQKNIPMGAGLGGASSNAATVLLALNDLWGMHLPLSELQTLALTLGADVPFFVQPATAAWVEGVGEQITPMPHMPAMVGTHAAPNSQLYFVIVSPNHHSNTAELFKHPALQRNCKPLKINQNAPIDLMHYFTHQHANYSNAMQAAFISTYPAMAVWLQQQCLTQPTINWRMSGSGSCFFAAFSDKQAQQACYQATKVPENWRMQLHELHV